MIRLSVDNVLLINTQGLSIVIDKPIPLSIGIPNPHTPPQTQFLRRQGDLPNWQDLIGSSLEELKMAHPGQYEGAGPIPQNPPRPGTVNTQETLKLMHTMHYDPEGRKETHPQTPEFDSLLVL